MDFSAPDKPTPSSNLDEPELRVAGDAALEERNRALRVMIGAAARGDIPAFEALYDTTAGWLLARVRRIAGEAHAEDVLSEVYLQVWRSLAGYDVSRGQPLAWLATIARSRALDKLRCERRSHGGQLDVPAFAPEEESHETGPEQLLATAERDRLLQRTLGALSAKEQLVLGMAHSRDCSQAEIASLTGLPLGSVKTLTTRSLQKLRLSLGGMQP
jgi:RNA polymerase sigma-70 factor (ECF subfamily)